MNIYKKFIASLVLSALVCGDFRAAEFSYSSYSQTISLPSAEEDTVEVKRIVHYTDSIIHFDRSGDDDFHQIRFDIMGNSLSMRLMVIAPTPAFRLKIEQVFNDAFEIAKGPGMTPQKIFEKLQVKYASDSDFGLKPPQIFSWVLPPKPTPVEAPAPVQRGRSSRREQPVTSPASVKTQRFDRNGRARR